MTVRAGPKVSGELGPTRESKAGRPARGIIGHLARHSPSSRAIQEDGAGRAGDRKEKNARPGVSRWPVVGGLMSGWMKEKAEEAHEQRN